MGSMSKTLQVRVEPEMMEYLQKKSEKNSTWVSEYIRDLIKKDMESSAKKATTKRRPFSSSSK